MFTLKRSTETCNVVVPGDYLSTKYVLAFRKRLKAHTYSLPPQRDVTSACRDRDLASNLRRGTPWTERGWRKRRRGEVGARLHDFLAVLAAGGGHGLRRGGELRMLDVVGFGAGGPG